MRRRNGPGVAVRSVAAGLAGTAAMTAGYAAEHRLRPGVVGPLDYDDSDVPGVIAGRVLRRLGVLRHRPGPGATKALTEVVHWGYGSAMGAVAVPLLRRTGPVRATLVYAAGISVMAGTLFPWLGGTPPPWRWRADVVATSLGQHLLYAATVVAVARAAGIGREDDEVAVPGDR